MHRLSCIVFSLRKFPFLQAFSTANIGAYLTVILWRTGHKYRLKDLYLTDVSMQRVLAEGSDSDGSRCRDRVEPTPTREQTALVRRSPQIGTRSGVPTFSFRQVDESEKILHFEHKSADGTGSRPKIRENEEYVSGNFAAVGPANATVQDTVARSTRQR